MRDEPTALSLWMQLVGVLATVVVLPIWRGFVTMKLWGWFAVPIGAPRVGLAVAIGLTFLIAHVVYRESPIQKKTDKEVLTGLLTVTLAPALSLGLGWFVHLWVTP